MNIEGAKKLSVSSSGATVEVGAQSMLDAGALPEGFADALTGQIKLVSEAKGLDAVPQPLQNSSSGGNLNGLQSLAVLLGNKGAAQELAVLFGKDLPMFYKVDDEADIEATLSALTEALNHVSTGSTVSQMNPEQASTGSDVLAFENQTDNPVASAEMIEVIKEMLDTAVFPGQEGKKFTEAAASKVKAPLSFANQPAEAIELNSSEQMASPDDFQQKDSVFLQIVQDGQGMIGLRKTGMTEKIEQAGQISVMETGNNLSQVAADIVQHNKQMVDIHADVPAMAKPVGHPEWHRDLGERIIWMHNKAMSAAEIKLNPQHLGPISVRIDMNQDQATVTFTSPHAAVREALEASVPRLREMMNAQQINLADVSVFQNPSEQRHSQSQGNARFANDWEQSTGGISDDAIIDVAEEADHNGAIVSKGLLSIYA